MPRSTVHSSKRLQSNLRFHFLANRNDKMTIGTPTTISGIPSQSPSVMPMKGGTRVKVNPSVNIMPQARYCSSLFIGPTLNPAAIILKKATF